MGQSKLINKMINENIDPEILRKFLKDLYVDDSTTSLDGEQSAVAFYQTTTAHMKNGASGDRMTLQYKRRDGFKCN